MIVGQDGWLVNAKLVERIWRREGLKVPQPQPTRGRLTDAVHDGVATWQKRQHEPAQDIPGRAVLRFCDARSQTKRKSAAVQMWPLSAVTVVLP